jgi:flagellin
MTMARIGAGAGGLDFTLQNSLVRAFGQLDRSGTRLATLQRINHGSDDPAGLIAAESLRAEITAIDAADRNAARAESLLAVADSGLAQVGDLLNTIRDGVLATSGNTLSDAERSAYQTQIDGALQAIDRISGSTEFNGQKLLDGSATALKFSFSSNPADAATLSIPSVSTHQLGSTADRLTELAHGGGASVESGNPAAALAIVDAARTQVLNARQQAGAFERFTIDSSREVLSASKVNLSSALSAIQDADVAAESAQYIRSQILAHSALTTLRLGSSRWSLLADLLPH